ncbi:MAG: 6,7-dimethyl-8-ribityllumazine synthase [Bdellovibrionales bacterium]
MEQKQTTNDYNFEVKPHVMIVEARYYEDIADQLLAGAKAELDRAGATYDVYTVPGALEIPAAVKYALRSLDYDPMRRRYDGYVALGTVIKGETRHDEIVGNVSIQGLQDLALKHVLAIGCGILTVNNAAQAEARAGQQNKGGGAAVACLRMIEMKNKFKLMPKRRWIGPK